MGHPVMIFTVASIRRRKAAHESVEPSWLSLYEVARFTHELSEELPSVVLPRRGRSLSLDDRAEESNSDSRPALPDKRACETEPRAD